MRWKTSFVVVWSLFLSGLATADRAAAAEIGIAVGDKAPAFSLRDQHGKEQSLEKLIEKGPVALVFFRSASW